jgi:hypothetical protein
MITPIGLNSIVKKGDESGMSALYWLACTPKGQEVLDNDAVFAMITNTCLNSIVQHGNDSGMSVLFWLTSRAQSLKRLHDNKILSAKINKSALNSGVQRGVHVGKSVLYLLMRSKMGMEILCSHALFKKMNPECINRITAKGDSALYYLVRTPLGQSLLTQYSKSLELVVTKEALNTVISDGPAKDESALYWLTASLSGQNILLENPSLRNLITPEGLNHIVTTGKGQATSPFYWLTGSENGRQILKQDQRLSGLITEETLNHPGPEHQRKSALYNLGLSSIGREILQQDALANKINQTGWNGFMHCVPQIKQHALHWLGLTRKGLSFLNQQRPLALIATQCPEWQKVKSKALKINGLKEFLKELNSKKRPRDSEENRENNNDNNKKTCIDPRPSL